MCYFIFTKQNSIFRVLKWPFPKSVGRHKRPVVGRVQNIGPVAALLTPKRDVERLSSHNFDLDLRLFLKERNIGVVNRREVDEGMRRREGARLHPQG